VAALFLWNLPIQRDSGTFCATYPCAGCFKNGTIVCAISKEGWDVFLTLTWTELFTINPFDGLRV